MAYEQKDNTGSLWINDRKEKDTHPDRTGTLLIEGRSYFLNGWLKQSKDGKPYLSLSVKPRTAAAETGPRKTQMDDEIPF